MSGFSLLVTGANGFLGAALCQSLSTTMEVSGAVRPSSIPCKGGAWKTVTGELSDSFDWTGALAGVSSLVHCAARVHVMRESSRDPLAAFRAINVDGTLNLARQAARAGIRRFVYISSIGVNGGETFAKPFSAEDVPAPHTPYAVSKYEAEIGLRELSAASGMEVVIVRPPLIYGPEAPGNFASLVKLLKSGLPIPLASVTANRRSFIYLGNLLSFIEACIVHPAAANRTFVISDGEDLSTADLLQRMGKAMGIRARLFSCPVGLLRFGAGLLGRSETLQSLCGSLQIDGSPAQNLLGWKAPFNVDSGLQHSLSLRPL